MRTSEHMASQRRIILRHDPHVCAPQCHRRSDSAWGPADPRLPWRSCRLLQTIIWLTGSAVRLLRACSACKLLLSFHNVNVRSVRIWMFRRKDASAVPISRSRTTTLLHPHKRERKHVRPLLKVAEGGARGAAGCAPWSRNRRPPHRAPRPPPRHPGGPGSAAPRPQAPPPLHVPPPPLPPAWCGRPLDQDSYWQADCESCIV